MCIIFFSFTMMTSCIPSISSFVLHDHLMPSLEGSGTFDILLVLSPLTMYILSPILVMFLPSSSRVLEFHVHTYIYPLIFHNKSYCVHTLNYLSSLLTHSWQVVRLPLHWCTGQLFVNSSSQTFFSVNCLNW
jgi:hypothetical protein